jgi:hypothetical protein
VWRVLGWLWRLVGVVLALVRRRQDAVGGRTIGSSWQIGSTPNRSLLASM